MFNTTNILIYRHPIIYRHVENPYDVLFGEQNLKKYHEESTNVSSVSVSLVKFFPSIFIFFQSVNLSRGFPVASN